jgi:hypothetical protein
MLIILLLLAAENDGGINCESEDIYERVQSNFFAVMARAVNFKRRPKGVCLHVAANNKEKTQRAPSHSQHISGSGSAKR